MTSLDDCLLLLAEERVSAEHIRNKLLVKRINSLLVHQFQCESNFNFNQNPLIRELVPPETLNVIPLISKIKGSIEVEFGPVETDFFSIQNLGFLLPENISFLYSKSKISRILKEYLEKINVRYITTEYSSFVFSHDELPYIWIITQK